VFDIKVLADAQKYAEENEIKIFSANIIYHLTDFFTKYVNEVREERKIKEGKEAVFPCVLKTIALFRKSDPIVLGVDVENGVLKIGTPLVIFREKDPKKPSQPQVKIGFVESIEHNHKKLKEARKNTGSVAISIGGDPSIEGGKQFNVGDKLVSLVSRRSIDCLKEHYREEVTKDEWQLVIELKKYFGIG
jgi:translation initiation factor 5B